MVDGATIWVRGIDNNGCRIIQNQAPLSPEEQVATSQRGFPAGGIVFEASLVNKAAAVIQLIDTTTGHSLEVPVASQELPLDSIQALGTDGAGNLYAMARIYEENWTGTESWCFMGVTRDGTSLGQLRLPLDFWAGGGWTVTPEGKILELRSTQDGIEVVEYELGGRP
jgi:hypothetical protein